MEFPKRYDPKSFEKPVPENDGNDQTAKPERGGKSPTFHIVMPPPNVTGKLHVWHAFSLTLQDAAARYRRMKGESVLWIPWTDHAGIAAQAKVEQRLSKIGKSAQSLGKEQLREEIRKWTDECVLNIREQARWLGASCDWSKERSTLDEGFNRGVESVFASLYEKGLVFREKRMVQYSPALRSVISDNETECREEESKTYYVTYFVSGSDNELTIATGRPETILADQAVAVHPKDKRFKKLIGRSVILPIVNKEIPIIADDSIDMENGTGAIKITPAHDAFWFEVAKRHALRTDYRVIDKNGVMTKEAGIFAWQDAATTARDNVVELLRTKGNLIRIESGKGRVRYCSRGGCKTETVVSEEWFVKTSELAKRVLAWYKKGEFKIVPNRFSKGFEDKIAALPEWCVSRQLAWGHEIPAYYDAQTDELLAVSIDAESVYAKFGKDRVRKDSWVLDTWFSSALWPFCSLDWDSSKPGDLFMNRFPSDVLSTGSDTFESWVIPMLLLGYECTGKAPFRTVSVHGLVFDENGRKMSKSSGNSTDPLSVVEDFSADALRLSLVKGRIPGEDFDFSIEDVAETTAFLSKIWNAARFVWTNCWPISENEADIVERIRKNWSDALPHEKWILSRMRSMVEEVSEGMDAFSFSASWENLVDFLRDEFADFAIEAYKFSKGVSKTGDDVMKYCLATSLKLLHPYAPFITEELYGRVTEGLPLSSSSWPACSFERDETLEKNFSSVSWAVREIRNMRVSKGLKSDENVTAVVRAPEKTSLVLQEYSTMIANIAKLSEITVTSGKVRSDAGLAYGVSGDAEIYLNAVSLADTEGEKVRLKSEILAKKELIRTIDLRLTNQEFIRNAPEKFIRAEQEKKRIAEEQLERLLRKFATYE